jgi:hypothetical protein
LFLRWPDLEDAFDQQRPYSWQYLYQIRLQFSRDLQQLLAGMSHKFHKREEISNSELSVFGGMIKECDYGYAFMMNDLMSIAYDDDV